KQTGFSAKKKRGSRYQAALNTHCAMVGRHPGAGIIASYRVGLPRVNKVPAFLQYFIKERSFPFAVYLNTLCRPFWRPTMPNTALTNQQFRLAARPTGLPKASDWQFTTEPLRELADGEILIE